MSKFPTVKFDAEVQPGKLTPALLKDMGATAPKGSEGGLVMLPVDEINVFPDLQPRVQGKVWQERVDALAADMKQRGFLASAPISVFTVEEKAEDGTVATVAYIANGHTRFAAVQKANADGANITAIPAIFMSPGTTIESVMADSIRLNNGEPLSPYEISVVVARLKGYGRTEDQIATEIGKTKRYVQDLLVLAQAPASVRNAVLKGEISAANAVRELRAKGADKGAESIGKAVEKAKASGKSRATPTTIKGTEKQTGKKAKAEKPAKAADADPSPRMNVPAVSDETFLRSAMTYATEHSKASDGMSWLKAFLANDKIAIGELEKWMGQPAGSFHDASLRTAKDDLDDL